MKNSPPYKRRCNPQQLRPLYNKIHEDNLDCDGLAYEKASEADGTICCHWDCYNRESYKPVEAKNCD